MIPASVRYSNPRLPVLPLDSATSIARIIDVSADVRLRCFHAAWGTRFLNIAISSVYTSNFLRYLRFAVVVFYVGHVAVSFAVIMQPCYDNEETGYMVC